MQRRGRMMGDDSGSAPPSAPAPSAGGGKLQSSERERILAALEQAAGNQTKAAKLLGVSRRTLITRLEEYDIPRPRKG